MDISLLASKDTHRTSYEIVSVKLNDTLFLFLFLLSFFLFLNLRRFLQLGIV